MMRCEFSLIHKHLTLTSIFGIFLDCQPLLGFDIQSFVFYILNLRNSILITALFSSPFNSVVLSMATNREVASWNPCLADSFKGLIKFIAAGVV